MQILRLTALTVALGVFLCVPQLTSAASAYTGYVACGYKTSDRPATACPKSGHIGAFFTSNNANVYFRACVTFPNGQTLCSKRASATKGTTYVSKITAGSKGTLTVRWRSGGHIVAKYSIKVT